MGLTSIVVFKAVEGGNSGSVSLLRELRQSWLEGIDLLILLLRRSHFADGANYVPWNGGGILVFLLLIILFSSLLSPLLFNPEMVLIDVKK